MIRWAILSLLLVARGAYAAAPPNPLPAANVATRTLDNGLTVVVRTDPVVPLAVVDLWVGAGSVDDGGTGAAHALEHMVFRGSKDIPSGRVDAAVEAAGGVVYAATFPDATHYWAAVPPERAETVISALADAMREPTVATDAWARERRVMLEEIARDRGDLAADARRALAGRLFGQPYGVPVAGTPAALGRLEPEDIRAFHRAHYRPDRMALVVVGRVEAEKIFARAKATLGALPKRTDRAAERSVPVTKDGPAEVEAGDGASVAVGYAWRRPSEDAAVVDVLNTVLRRRLVAALGGRARRVEVQHPWQRAGMVLVVAEGAERDRAAIRAAMRSVLFALPEGISPAEVASAVSHRRWSWWLEHEKPVVQARTLGLAATLGAVSDATEAHARLGRVTVEDVRAAARKMSLP